LREDQTIPTHPFVFAPPPGAVEQPPGADQVESTVCESNGVEQVSRDLRPSLNEAKNQTDRFFLASSVAAMFFKLLKLIDDRRPLGGRSRREIFPGGTPGGFKIGDFVSIHPDPRLKSPRANFRIDLSCRPDGDRADH
jgi:hypothetical protein